MNPGRTKAIFAGVAAVAGLTACDPTRINSPPTLSNISDQETVEDAPKTIVFAVSDPDTPLDKLRLSALTDNSALVPSKNIVFSGSGTNRSVTISPAKDQFGQTKITVEANDGMSHTNVAFLLVVRPCNGCDLPAVISKLNP